jgi:GNAT superfamily N-acetyltransferase
MTRSGAEAVADAPGEVARIVCLQDGVPDDLLRLWRSYQLFYGVPPGQIDAARNRAHVATIVASPDRGTIFALELGPRCIGFATIYYSFSSTAAAPLGVINDLFVDESHRGRGHGRRLLEHCLGFLRRRGVAIAEWATLADNRRAQALYDRYATPGAWYVYRVLP